MKWLFSNNARGQLVQAVQAADTFILVTDETEFPSPGPNEGFKVTLEDRRTGQLEILDCTSRLGNRLNVMRGREGTTARDWAANTLVAHRMTAEVFEYLRNITYGTQTQTVTHPLVVQTLTTTNPPTLPATGTILNAGTISFRHGPNNELLIFFGNVLAGRLYLPTTAAAAISSPKDLFTLEQGDVRYQRKNVDRITVRRRPPQAAEGVDGDIWLEMP